MYFHLVEKIGLNFSLRWVAHTWISELWQKRVELSSQLPRVLESQQRVGLRDIVTGDESWFLQHSDHRRIWWISANEVPTRVTHTITVPKKNWLCSSVSTAPSQSIGSHPGKIQQQLLLRKDDRIDFRNPARRARCRVPKADSAFWWCHTPSITCN
jgi:hypothetical protein